MSFRQGISVMDVLPVQFANPVGRQAGPRMNRRRAGFVANHAHRQIQLQLFPVVAVFGDAHGLAPKSFFGSIEPNSSNGKRVEAALIATFRGSF